MSISTALKARREALRDREAGFTLIELLVVVIIIGILAAIAIPVYLGVQNNARDSAVKSDLSINKTAISSSAANSSTGALPTSGSSATDLSTALKQYGWVISDGATFTSYTTYGTGTATTFCLIEASATGQSFFVTTNKPVTQGTGCGTNTTW